MKIYVKGFLNFILFETKKMMEPGIMKMYRIGLIIFFGFFFHFKMFFFSKIFLSIFTRNGYHWKDRLLPFVLALSLVSFFLQPSKKPVEEYSNHFLIFFWFSQLPCQI